MPLSRNPNLRRRLLPGIAVLVTAPLLRLLTVPLRRRARAGAPLWVFSSYMVGDLFMALPALRRLAATADLHVICRPDCAAILANEGFRAIPFDNAFFVRADGAALRTTLRAAWALRALPAPAEALDLDADPRTALWLRVAGVPRIVSYRRPFGALFDAVFPLPPGAVHQADKNRAVIGGVLRGRGASGSEPRDPTPDGAATAQESPAPWIVSLWTRKPAKNWPLDAWEAFLDRLRADGTAFAILHAPDGDADYAAFRERWRAKAPFVEGTLEEIAESVRASAGIIATDNFLGHMAGYYGKPVLWINVSSPAEQVTPQGPRTVAVGDGTPENPRLPSVEAVRAGFAALAARA